MGAFFFVTQKGRLRGVIDFRALNIIPKANNAPITCTDEMFDRLRKVSYYSKLDLQTGFHQIRIAPEDAKNTAFKTEYGHYKFFSTPIEVTNAPATFQSPMKSIFNDVIDNYFVVYLNDILIYSNTREDHLQHLRNVLQRLKHIRLYAGRIK